MANRNIHNEQHKCVFSLFTRTHDGDIKVTIITDKNLDQIEGGGAISSGNKKNISEKNAPQELYHTALNFWLA